jgi:S-adenosylmethionine hydrolase
MQRKEKMNTEFPAITLLTDFGEDDGFVGTMKGVMQSIHPQAKFIDITHKISPQDIHQAAFILMTSTPFFPPGTVHLIVVDPGVGSHRRPIAVKTDQYQFVAPDNGVLSYVLPKDTHYQAYELANPTYHLPDVSYTFHGRDIFSPAAAHLAAGVPIDKLGPLVNEIVRLELPTLVIEGDQILGEVLNIDHFGNVRTSIASLAWGDPGTLELHPLWGRPEQSPTVLRFSAKDAEVYIGGRMIAGISETFSSVLPGQEVAFIGSEHALELAVNQGSMVNMFGISRGDEIKVLFKPS